MFAIFTRGRLRRYAAYDTDTLLPRRFLPKSANIAFIVDIETVTCHVSSDRDRQVEETVPPPRCCFTLAAALRFITALDATPYAAAFDAVVIYALSRCRRRCTLYRGSVMVRMRRQRREAAEARDEEACFEFTVVFCAIQHDYHVYARATRVAARAENMSAARGRKRRYR